MALVMKKQMFLVTPDQSILSLVYKFGYEQLFVRHMFSFKDDRRDLEQHGFLLCLISCS